jgi:uncharacterized protein (TIGR00251 family)
MTAIPIQENAEGATFAVRVHPGARKSGVTGVHDGALKISLQTPPVDGRANEALVKFVAEWLAVPRARVSIVSGEHSRSKWVRVAGLAAAKIETEIQGLGISG